jgi:hypothetical protein|tara:strand:- start:180 stop:410 length:231 start_codon:yes stop_codon:yes gene_type:complete
MYPAPCRAFSDFFHDFMLAFDACETAKENELKRIGKTLCEMQKPPAITDQRTSQKKRDNFPCQKFRKGVTTRHTNH